jgi:hypothetical protein
MTLMDAPQFNARRARLIRDLSITALVVVIVGFIGGVLFSIDYPWQVWNWPADHRVDVMLEEVEAGQLQKAFGQWNNDADWQQHADRYKLYSFADFEKDWGPASDYGVIKSHRLVVAKRVGNGVVMGVDINGGSTPIFLRVDNKSRQIGFSPVELYVGP